jgi:hypothetical protein
MGRVLRHNPAPVREAWCMGNDNDLTRAEQRAVPSREEAQRSWATFLASEAHHVGDTLLDATALRRLWTRLWTSSASRRRHQRRRGPVTARAAGETALLLAGRGSPGRRNWQPSRGEGREPPAPRSRRARQDVSKQRPANGHGWLSLVAGRYPFQRMGNESRITSGLGLPAGRPAWWAFCDKAAFRGMWRCTARRRPGCRSVWCRPRCERGVRSRN